MLPTHDDAPNDASRAAFTQHLFVRDKTTELVRRRTKEGVLEIGTNAQRLGDETLAAMAPAGPPSDLACKKGCSWCCYLHVDATWPEVFHLAEVVQAWPEAQRSALLERLRASVKRIEGLDVEQRALARVPCALLVDRQCAAYESRPLKCRSYTSFSEKTCKRALRPGRVPDTRAWGESMLAYDPVYTGVAQGLEDAGLPAVVELNRGLLSVLTSYGAFEQWLKGQEPTL